MMAPDHTRFLIHVAATVLPCHAVNYVINNAAVVDVVYRHWSHLKASLVLTLGQRSPKRIEHLGLYTRIYQRGGCSYLTLYRCMIRIKTM